MCVKSLTLFVSVDNDNNNNKTMKEMLYAARCLKSNEDMILALAGQFKQFLSYDIPFTGKHEPNKLTCSTLCDFIAQLVRALPVSYTHLTLPTKLEV